MRAPQQPRHYWYSQLTSVKLIKPVLCACAQWMKTACFLYTRNTNREKRDIQAYIFWLLQNNELEKQADGITRSKKKWQNMENGSPSSKEKMMRLNLLISVCTAHTKTDLKIVFVNCCL